MLKVKVRQEWFHLTRVKETVKKLWVLMGYYRPYYKVSERFQGGAGAQRTRRERAANTSRRAANMLRSRHVYADCTLYQTLYLSTASTVQYVRRRRR